MAKHLNKGISQGWAGVTALLTPQEDEYLGIESSNNRPVDVSLKYLDLEYQCFSEWEKDELQEFSKFIKKLRGLAWKNVDRDIGLRKKSHMRQDLPRRDVLKRISKDTRLFELRIAQKPRVHGFRVKSTFFLVWLDRQHEIYPM